jgi:hypothetical protein
VTCFPSIDTISHDPKYETAEGLVDWNLEDSSSLPDLSDFAGMSSTQYSYEEAMSLFCALDSTLDYDYMRAIDEFVSNEEKGEICDESSLPSPSSLVPGTSHGMAYHSPTLDTRSIPQLSLAQSNTLNLIGLSARRLRPIIYFMPVTGRSAHWFVQRALRIWRLSVMDRNVAKLPRVVD